MNITNETELRVFCAKSNATRPDGKKITYECGMNGFRIVYENCRVTKSGKVTNISHLYDWGSAIGSK